MGDSFEKRPALEGLRHQERSGLLDFNSEDARQPGMVESSENARAALKAFHGLPIANDIRAEHLDGDGSRSIILILPTVDDTRGPLPEEAGNAPTTCYDQLAATRGAVSTRT